MDLNWLIHTVLVLIVVGMIVGLLYFLGATRAVHP